MTEVRPIHASEAETFLTLLCKVFELDIERARSIFYNEPFYDLKRKWALFEAGSMVSILTTVPLEFGWGRAIGIAGVATEPDHRRQGHGLKLLREVLQQSDANGEGTAFLFAKDARVYENAGFEVLDAVIEAPILHVPETSPAPLLSTDEVRMAYDAWSLERDNRLRRDARRWKFWSWNLRMCTASGSGYVCLEGDTVREAVHASNEPWPLRHPAKWLGLGSLAEGFGVPIGPTKELMHFMGFGARQSPEMFLTDQF